MPSRILADAVPKSGSLRQLWQCLHRRRPQQLRKRRGMRLTLPRLNKSDRDFRQISLPTKRPPREVRSHSQVSYQLAKCCVRAQEVTTVDGGAVAFFAVRLPLRVSRKQRSPLGIHACVGALSVTRSSVKSCFTLHLFCIPLPSTAIHSTHGPMMIAPSGAHTKTPSAASALNSARSASVSLASLDF